MAINTVFLLILNAITTLAVKKSSLTFVIDDTASMYTEIENVISGTKYIVDVIFSNGSSQIEDLILVTFNDPDVVFRVRTKDRNEFKRKLENMRVHEGGDCPEMSLTGLERGIIESQPGSFIFLFTDDGPKDATVDVIERIKSLCQEKESHVVFVVTPSNVCLDADFSFYYDIAQSSTGQVLRLDQKYDVSKIMPYINNTVTGDRTLITSKTLPALQWTDIPFEIDDQTQYAVASTSGSHVEFRLFDKHNVLITDYEPLVWIENVKVVKINKPGRYTAKVISSSTASIVVLGRTDFTFEPGFSETEITSFDNAKKQPYEGIKTHLWISINEPKHLIEISSAEILDMNEGMIHKLPLKNVYDDVYVTDLFLTPNSMFKIAVNGIVRKTGKTIKRFAKVPVEPKKPKLGPPQIITIGGNIDVVLGDKVLRIPCIAVGYPVPSIKWFINGTLLEKGDQYSVENGTLIIKNVSSKGNSIYTCQAENSYGNVKQNNTVSIENTVDVHDPATMYIMKSRNSTLECPLAITKTDSVRWFKNGYFHSEGRFKYITDASTVDDGNYTCRVSNDFGSQNGKTIQVIVDVPPTRRGNVKAHSIIDWEKSEGVINCGVEIFRPTVQIQWFYNGLLIKNQDDLDLNFLTWGNYTCKVTNTFGTVENSFLITSEDCLIDINTASSNNMPLILNELSELPNFNTKQHHITVSRETTLKLFCNEGFKGFSDKKEIKVSCLKEDQFIVNNDHHKFSDFYCNAKMTAQTKESKKSCAGNNTKIITIGFNAGKFVEVLETCYDTDKKVPIFEKTIISNPKFEMNQDIELSYQNYVYGEYDNKILKSEHASENSNCSYVNGLLTNVEDISFGVAQRGVLENHNLNDIFYLSCYNNSNWKQIEESVRRYISGNRDDSSFTVWSGTSNYEFKNEIWVPRYLWKVIKTSDSKKSLAIVTVNNPNYSESDRLCGEEDLCYQSWISEVADWPTYCCQVSDFSKAFNISDNTFRS